MKTIFNKKVKSLVQNFVKIPIFSPIFIKYCQYFSFWLLTCGGSVGHNIDLNSEFLLGTKIAHVWEENESLVISICGLEASERGSYKKAIKTGHPVFACNLPSYQWDWSKRLLYLFDSIKAIKIGDGNE